MSTDASQPAIQIRDITDLAEMRAVEELQKEIWGVGDREVVPALAMLPITAVGGVLIGAFDENRLVGFVFGFLGLDQGQITLHSDMLAVKAEYRSQGLGYQLKLAQRERALNKGIFTITWTFDPLQSANAHLNFARLGVVADRYLVNFYGETTSFLHRSGTDRLWLTWLLNSERVKQRTGDNLKSVLPSAEVEGLLTILRIGDDASPRLSNRKPEGDRVLIEIPGKLNKLASHDFKLALQWREASRAAFTKAIDSGYRVEEFYRKDRDSEQIGVYLLAATH